MDIECAEKLSNHSPNRTPGLTFATEMLAQVGRINELGRRISWANVRWRERVDPAVHKRIHVLCEQLLLVPSRFPYSQLSLLDSRFKIQEGLLTNAKVYIHVTIWIKVVTQTAMYSQYYIHDLQRNK